MWFDAQTMIVMQTVACGHKFEKHSRRMLVGVMEVQQRVQHLRLWKDMMLMWLKPTRPASLVAREGVLY
jgi:hypothetical protein